MSKLPVRPQRDPLSPLTKAIFALIQGLLPPLSAIAVGAWAIFTYIDHQKEARVQQTVQSVKDDAARLFESQKPFNQKQLELYMEAAQVVGRLVSADADNFGKDEWKKDVGRYNAMYWTELSMVEDEEVKRAMEQFRPVLLRTNAANTLSEADRGNLQTASYHLAKALNVSISSRWIVRLSEVEEKDITICRGSPGNCGEKDEEIGCGSPADWATRQCLNYSATLISSRDGGMCGYPRFAVKCTKRKAG
jgi:hypothetical protein